MNARTTTRDRLEFGLFAEVPRDLAAFPAVEVLLAHAEEDAAQLGWSSVEVSKGKKAQEIRDVPSQ